MQATNGHVAAAQSSASSQGSKPQALNTMQLLEALRTYDTNSSPQQASELVSLLQSVPPASSSGKGKPTPLHLAVRCARASAIPLILDHRAADLNAKDASGSTPLHLACALGRADLVAVLLSQADIDDTIKDDEGKTCLERAKSGDVARLISTSRSQFNQTYLERVGEYINSGSSEPLLQWLQRNRSACIDFSGKVKGTTILHEAARRKDLSLLQMCVEKGADVLARDARGKSPVDVAKDGETRAWFKQAMIKEGAALKANPGSIGSLSDMAALTTGRLPVRKGYLEKWTNLAKGYKQRWFVLANGQLTYYRHQDEEGKASRGTIMLNHAQVTGLSEDKLKFEISSNIAKFKFYCKADHPLEAVRWVEDLKTHIEATSGGLGQQAKGHTSTASLSSVKQSTPGGLTTSTSPAGEDIARPISSASSISSTTATTAVDPSVTGDKRQSKLSALKNRVSLSRKNSSANLSNSNPTMSHLEPPTPLPSRTDDISSAPSLAGSVAALSIRDETDNASLITFAGELDDGARPPHEEDFSLLATSAKAQVEASESLLDSLDGPNQAEVKIALRQSLKRLASMLDDYSERVGDRETWYTRRFEREVQTRKLWEENMHQVAAQQEELEKELQRTAAKGSRRKKELREVRMELLSSPTKTITPDGQDSLDDNDLPRGSATQGIAAQLGSSDSPAQAPTTVVSTLQQQSNDASSDSDDEDDEFYEAIDSGNLPVTVDVHIQSPTSQPWPKEALDDDMKERVAAMSAYKNTRTSLPITNDDRPSVSLWGILKNSIGKDLTKISFPVSFNEPTSMLQRMAEDMEFSECLDAAALSKEATTRIAYVAAFAMSNYSSTIGRIAKPFNPMLGETFEYASHDKHYRYMSEQVSHHPPISACIGESPNWQYYGEVDARNKFLGKSFEIRPTGIAHCKLRLPAEWVTADYPKDTKGKALEHYSWKKVTTSVSNFIMGSPIIDHYGDMTITNHRTGDKCTLTFKPRGWRGSNAREIKGEVVDASGRKIWDIAGRWSTQLVARRAGHSGGELQPDAEVPKEDEYILLWKNSEQPPNSPFNLTPYAITLNNKDPALVPQIPPTDCRMRPDLHAFESGHFEEANNLKTGLETLQRKTRQKRETGELPPHKPRWFSRQRDPDTGEGYWEPAKVDGIWVEYWEERFKIVKAKEAGQQAEWPTEHIFGDYELI